MVDAQVVVDEWQPLLSHCALVDTCVADLACAFWETYVPLWQLEHCPPVPVWLICGARKLVVLTWQVSHCAVVGMWLALLPWAGAPAWQVLQAPEADASWV